jgi:hypothetical protein
MVLGVSTLLRGIICGKQNVLLTRMQYWCSCLLNRCIIMVWLLWYFTLLPLQIIYWVRSIKTLLHSSKHVGFEIFVVMFLYSDQVVKLLILSSHKSLESSHQLHLKDGWIRCSFFICLKPMLDISNISITVTYKEVNI